PAIEKYLHYVRSREQPLRTFRELDAELFGFLTPETDPRELPAGVDERVLGRGRPSTDVGVVEEGDVIDLGGRALRVLHTPGHSPDGISLLDEKHGLLLSADAFNVGLVYCHFDDSSLVELKQTAARFADMVGDVAFITAHHYPSVIAETNLLLAYRDAVEQI